MGPRVREREAQRRGSNALPAVSDHYLFFLSKETQSGGFHSDSLDVESPIQASTAHYFWTCLIHRLYFCGCSLLPQKRGKGFCKRLVCWEIKYSFRGTPGWFSHVESWAIRLRNDNVSRNRKSPEHVLRLTRAPLPCSPCPVGPEHSPPGWAPQWPRCSPPPWPGARRSGPPAGGGKAGTAVSTLQPPTTCSPASPFSHRGPAGLSDLVNRRCMPARTAMFTNSVVTFSLPQSNPGPQLTSGWGSGSYPPPQGMATGLSQLWRAGLKVRLWAVQGNQQCLESLLSAESSRTPASEDSLAYSVTQQHSGPTSGWTPWLALA